MPFIADLKKRKGWNKLIAGLIMLIMWYVLFGNHKYSIYGKKHTESTESKETPAVSEEYKKPGLETETP